MKPPMVMTNAFFGVKDPVAFRSARDTLFGSLQDPSGLYSGDNLIAFGRTLGFLDDPEFAAAIQKHLKTSIERGAIWRYVVLAWAARQCMRLDGDFVECACYRGTTARIITDLTGLAGTNRRYFLYDIFEHDQSMPHHSMPDHGQGLFEQVKARFADAPNVIVTKGRAPDSLDQNAPDKIAFMQIDMNNAEAEIGVLERLFDRMVPGAVLVLDDFGWSAYKRQFVAETKWFGDRGYHVLELPTGQGLVVK